MVHTDRVTRGAAVAALAVALAGGLAGCAGATPAPASSGTTATPAVNGAPVPGQPVSDPRKPLDLPAEGKVLLQVAGRTGSAQLPAIAHLDADTVGLVVVCNGPGKIVVDIGQMAKFGIVCGNKSAGQYNEIGLGSARSQVPVSVEGSAGNTWAVTVGWYSTPPQV